LRNSRLFFCWQIPLCQARRGVTQDKKPCFFCGYLPACTNKVRLSL